MNAHVLSTPSSTPATPGRLAFIGGGNMASAILGGLIQAGRPAASIVVVEPWAPQAQVLRERFGVEVHEAGGPALQGADTVVWAVKPQMFTEAAAPCAPFIGPALQLSVMAGIRSDAIARATGSERVVRAMPNTPALIGLGISGLFARAAVTAADRAGIEAVLAPTGRTLWVADERDLDAVTALSGSGPAYVFFFIEAMMKGAEAMGLSAEQGRQLALATFEGATALALQSTESPEVLRGRVTSKGGTTHAAVTTMQSLGLDAGIVQALQAAQHRAKELGDEFGG